MTFTPAETAACRRLVEMALEEDLGTTGDITSQVLIPRDLHGKAAVVARAPGVVAGLPAIELVLGTPHTPHLKVQLMMEDGTRVKPGDRMAIITGLMEFILTAERTALNFLQHLSGIATLTRWYVDAVAGLSCQILDTRKTLPGWRLLEKYAVRCGGGQNHRMGLYDGLLVKDNHLAAVGGGKDAFRRLICVPRPGERSQPLEIEVDSLDQLDWALASFPEIVLLDNMTPDKIRAAVLRRNEKAPKVLLEASGGITLENVRAIAETGVDRISVGALTHSAPALDIALDYLQ
jgi:nicotinate-nucleotide pyrophosphorylase (carboxylating)